MPRFMRRVRQTLTATAGLALFNLVQTVQAGPLMSELPGQTGYWTSPQGKLFYKTVGTGEPLVLLHGFNAAASSYEMRRIVAPLAEHFQVYALDWLGFGLSDRPKLRYTADLYVSLLDGFVRDVVKTPTHVVASSLASAYVIRHAAAHPDRYRRLVLVAPTGIETLAAAPGAAQQALRDVLVTPLLGEFLFNLLVTPTSLTYFLKREGYYDASLLTSDVVDAYFATSHQPGARYAPASFIGGLLNMPIRRAWESLPHPTLIAWGRDAISTPVETAQAFTALRPTTRLEVFDRCRLLPHDEHAERFSPLVLDFLTQKTPTESSTVV